MRQPANANFKPNSLLAPVLRTFAAITLIAWFSLSLAQTSPLPNIVGRGVEPSLSYTVKPSDKLIRMSSDMLVNPQAWNEIAKYNGLKNPNVIFPGQKLNIPLRFLKFQPADGKVISAEGDVLLSDTPMQVGAAVTNGSKFRTGPNSSAVIELADGSRVKLLPNSLAEIVSSRNYAMRDASQSGSSTWFSGLLRLSAGALEALASKTTQRATPLQIETPTSLVGVRGTAFRVAFDDPAGKNSRTEVTEGSVRADNTSQQSGVDLPMGTGAVVNPAEKEVLAVKLLPAPDMTAVATDVFKPAGIWFLPVVAGASAYRVQVASDQGFDKIVRDLKVSSGSVEIASLPKGSWFARVRGIDAKGLEGFDSVKLIAVKDGQWRISDSSMRIVDGKTMLSWAGATPDGQAMPTGTYSVVVATDAALTQAVASAEGSNAKLDLGALKAGIYFLRLSSKPLPDTTAANSAADSEIYRFEISANWGETVFYKTSALQAVR